MIIPIFLFYDNFFVIVMMCSIKVWKGQTLTLLIMRPWNRIKAGPIEWQSSEEPSRGIIAYFVTIEKKQICWKMWSDQNASIFNVFPSVLLNCSNFLPSCFKPPYIHTAASVTRLGDLLNFGQVFKAFGNN